MACIACIACIYVILIKLVHSFTNALTHLRNHDLKSMHTSPCRLRTAKLVTTKAKVIVVSIHRL